MTTRELIAALTEADPDGNAPVCVGNHDVYFVERLPWYYDGRLQQLVHDPEKRGKAWSIIGARIGPLPGGDGTKVNIRPMSIRDVLVDHPDLPIEGGDPETIACWRAEAREP